MVSNGYNRRNRKKKPNSGSIIENKGETKRNLDNFLNQRPPPTALEQKGIVTDPNKKEQKRTTIDVLSSFFSKTKKDGKDNKDGKDGKDNKDGKDGKDNKDGKDGKDSKDGKDGKEKPEVRKSDGNKKPAKK